MALSNDNEFAAIKWSRSMSEDPSTTASMSELRDQGTGSSIDHDRTPMWTWIMLSRTARKRGQERDVGVFSSWKEKNCLNIE